MKPFAWSPQKNAQLIAERQLCFESVVVAIEAGELLDVLEHPNQQRYPGQRVLVVRLEGYVHLVPYVETAEHLFLTISKQRTTAMPEQNPAIQLDSEEQELLSDYDAGAWRSVATPGVLQSLREAALATGQKEQLVIQEQPAIQAAR